MRNSARLVLAFVVLAYLLLAVQYARLTPAWQAADEPAHFNYVRYVAERGALPVLQAGDYPHAYLEEIKAKGFPPEMSIDPIRYEAWQPPLYYLLAAGIQRLALAWPTAQQLLALRLLSVAFGTLLLLIAYQVAGALAPGRTWLALGATALVATVPMHIAITAAVNNDTLAELWVGLLLWQLLVRVRDHGQGLRRWLVLGVTLGLAALTKISTCFMLPPILGGLAYIASRQAPGRARGSFLLRRVLAVCLPALLLMVPWLARNMAVYGPGDPLAFARHNAVVEGQLRTADWLAQVGLRRAATDFLVTTFHSFWGQFGWMGVPIDLRLYRALAFLTGLAALGLLLRLAAFRDDWRRTAPEERAGLLLLGASALLVAGSLLWYNLSFVQHQGRYLFPALIPTAIFLTIGWHEITRRGRRALCAALPLAAALLLAGHDLLRRQPCDKWTSAGLLGLSGTFGVSIGLPETWSRWLYALPYPLFLLLDLACLYAFILPALA